MKLKGPTSIFKYAHLTKLRTKIFITFFFLAICLSIFYNIYFNRAVSTILLNYLFSASTKLVENTNAQLADEMENILKTSNTFLLDRNVQEILKKDSDAYPLSDQLRDFSILEDIVNECSNKSPLISRCYIAVNPNFYYAKSKDIVHGLDDQMFESLEKVLTESQGALVYGPPITRTKLYESGTQVIPAGRMLIDLNDFTQFIGTLYFDISIKALQEILMTSSFANNNIFLFSDNNELIASFYSSNRTIPPSIDVLKEFISDEKSDSLTFRDSYFIKRQVGEVGWTIVSVLDIDNLKNVVLGFRQKIIGAFILVLFLSFLLALYISGLLVKRIKKSTSVMEESLQQGFTDIEVVHDDEISLFEKGYNNMADEIRTLLSKQFEQGQEIQRIRFEALTAQVNPHFLYNAFNTINLLSLKYDNPEITKIVRNLAVYYKLSLNKGNDEITIANEVSHSMAYLEIQKIRFEKNIDLQVILLENLEDYMIPNLIFQPLIENSFEHGLLSKKPDELAIIRITAQVISQTLVFFVEDSGKGIEGKEMKNVLKDQSKRKEGYGLYNVDKRIKLKYGNLYGLSFADSHLGGLKVVITLPFIV